MLLWLVAFMLGLSEWKHLKFNWPKTQFSNPVHSISLPHSYLFFQSGRAFFFLSPFSFSLLSPIWASPRIAGVVFKLWFTDSDWNGEGEEERRERGRSFFPTLPLVFSPSRISSDPFAAIDFASKRYLSPDRAQRCNEARQPVARSLDFEISLQWMGWIHLGISLNLQDFQQYRENTEAEFKTLIWKAIHLS